MDEKELQARLDSLLKLKESHLQDVEELGMVIEGLKVRIESLKKNPSYTS